MQRLLDIILSIIALSFLSFVFIPIIIILKFTGEGEVFYIQERSGKNGQPFGLLKFATMIKDSPNIGAGDITIKNDPRVLPFGKFLRKSKLNELPQLWNILLGDMSIVGPRPMVIKTYLNYAEDVRNELNKVRPGLTGIGSIIFRDEESIMDGQPDPVNFYKNVIAKYKGELEEWHVTNKSLYIYFLLIILTIYVVIFPSSKIVWKVFDNLPKPPDELYKSIKYID